MDKEVANNGATGHSDNGASPSVMPAPAANGHVVTAASVRESFAAPVEGDEAARVMLEFQQVMQRFLETQRDVMLAYLGGTPGGPALPLADGSQSALLSPSYVSLPEAPPRNGHTTVPAAGTMPPAVSQVAPPAEEPVGIAPGEQAAPVLSPIDARSEPAPDRDGLTRRLLEIASDRTGYPPDMLDLNADIEADLGIDSIKRVEILGAFRRSLDAAQLSSEQLAEHLTGIKTFRGIVDVIHGLLRASPVGSSPESQPDEPGVVGGDRQAPEPEHGTPLPRFVLKAVDASR
jgi:acyl carrier protein